MSKKIACDEFAPKAIGKIRKGNFYIPDCPDYKPWFNIPGRAKIGEVLIGWHCRNCKNFKVS